MRALLLDEAHGDSSRTSPSSGARRSALVLLGVLVLVIAVVLLLARGQGGGQQQGPSSGLASPVQPEPSDQSEVRQAPTNAQGQPYRAFEANSWWNTSIPANAPENSDADKILDYLRNGPDSGEGCLRLAGAHLNRWGQPVYWARPGDTQYDVSGVGAGRPPELSALRIPANAEPARNSDGTMTIYDLRAGYVTLLTDARHDEADDHWSASGATVTYLDSNGLDVRTGRSDNPGNVGTHRGNNGATSVVRWDMVRAGDVDSVLKVSAGPELSTRWVFPMTGSDGDASPSDPAIPPEGLRLRIKPAIDLDQLGLHPQAFVIARALQQYGMYLGDGGGATALKLEDTVSEGRGQLWDLTTEDLCGLPFTPAYWDVLPEGYDPTSVTN